MNRFPFGRGRGHSKFASPLVGMVYDNKKYEESCFFGRTDTSAHEASSASLEYTKSTPISLHKIAKNRQPEGSPEGRSEMLLKCSKVFEVSNRLSNPPRDICSRHRWVSCQSSEQVHPVGYVRRNMRQAINLDTHLSSVNLKEKEEIKKFRFPDIQVLALDTVREDR
jgi:hypothetical protein